MRLLHALPAAVLAAAATLASGVAAAEDAPFAWRSDAGVYAPPDFEAYFPDDAEGAAALDRWWRSPERDAVPDAEVLRIARGGIRAMRPRTQQMPVIRWIGNRMIWGVDPQVPEAIEWMYHLSDAIGSCLPDAASLARNAVYFGLSVADPKTPALRRAMAELSLRSDDPNLLHRVSWAARDDPEAFAAYLAPALASDDDALRATAEVRRDILTGRVKAFAWAEGRAREAAAAEHGGSLEAFRATLLHGSSEERRALLLLMARDRVFLLLDETFVPALAEAARDPDPRVRKAIAIHAGERFVWKADPQVAGAIDLMMTLTFDPDREVAHRAMYHGLSTVQAPDPRVRARLRDIGAASDDPNVTGRVVWALSRHPDAP